jgi:hypothetical protein
MVRILVATVVREALMTLSDTEENYMDENRLLSLIQAKDRTKTAKAASSKGLFFLGASFQTE